RQELLLLLLRAETKDAVRDLPVADPMGRDRGAGREQLLDDHEALDLAAVVAAVAAGKRHADPAAAAQPSAEIPIEAAQPAVDHRFERACLELVFQKRPNLPAESDAGVRQRLRAKLDVEVEQSRLLALSRTASRVPRRAARADCRLYHEAPNPCSSTLERFGAAAGREPARSATPNARRCLAGQAALLGKRVPE